jgi:hypothetical protein
MAISVELEAPIEENQFLIERPLPERIYDQDDNDFKKREHIQSQTSIDTGSWFFPGDRRTDFEEYPTHVEPVGFPINRPWIPPKALELLDKLKKGPITERQLVMLMELVGKRASEHFQLRKGKFVAMTFRGRVVEVADTRVSLLKKIQGQKYREQVFVWRSGYKAFSGRI